MGDMENAPMLNRCPHCGSENAGEARFCGQCARPLPLSRPEAPAVAICQACGAADSPGLSYCEQCGSRLAGPPPTPVVVPAAVPPVIGKACPSCGAANRVEVAFCERCGAGLVPAAPAARHRPSRHRSRLGTLVLILGLLLLLCSPCIVAGVASMRDAARSRPRLTQEQALALVGEGVAQHYPELVGIRPQVHEAQFGRDSGYRIVYRMEGQTDASPSRTVIFSVNAVAGEIFVVASQ